jgi:glyoxylase I family protein
MHITQCLHTAILVSDLAQAEHFYGNILGLPKVDRELRFPGAWYEVNGYQIHLMVGAPADLHNPEKWGRNRHLAFAVVDLEAAKAELIAHNCPVQLSASGRSALFTQDPDGNVVELSQIE